MEIIRCRATSRYGGAGEMGARVGTAPCPWTVGVSLIIRQPRLRQAIAGTCSNSHVSVPPSLSVPRLVYAASAAEVAADTLPPPAAPAPAPAPSSLPLEDEEGGPIQLPDYEDPLAIPSEGVTPLQTAASVVLTGAIAFLLFRSLRRRAKMAKETKVRSIGSQNINEAAMKANVLTDKVVSTGVMPKSPPSAWQTFQGAVIAGAIAVVLYKFATYVDAGFAAKPVTSVYTIRQLTITIRTIVNGLCYLATFVYAANSIGLMVYSIQLLLNLGPTEPVQEGDDKAVTAQDPLQTDSLEEVKEE